MKKNNKIIGYKTVDGNMCSWHDSSFQYEVGKTYTVKNAPNDRMACGKGLHFCQYKKYVKTYCGDKRNYILLQVEADPKDILGFDATKTRVKKLKVVKVLSKKGLIIAEHSSTIRAIEDFLSSKKIGNFNPKDTVILNKKIKELTKILSLKDSLTLNSLLEFSLITERCFKLDELVFGSLEFINIFVKKLLLKFNSKTRLVSLSFPTEVSEDIENLITNLLCSYLEANNKNKNKNSIKYKTNKLILEILNLGALPLGKYKNKLIVFIPNKNDCKLM